jgi:predicted CXXCH cytochrome family protein
MDHIAPKAMLLALTVLFLGLAGSFHAARAQSTAPPPDLACRDCHEGSAREFVFPSGETVAVGIDLTTLDASPHRAAGADPVACTDCHAGHGARYRYPHETNPAQTQREFAVEVSGNCQECHYPHKPFHPIAESEAGELQGGLPVCADCHGSHDIARVDAMPDDMPARCLACHSEQDDEWVAHFVAPRPGLGEGAQGYAGSTRCNGCHDDMFFTWYDTLHAQLIQDPANRPEAILGDFTLEHPDLTFGPEDVAYTIGSRWRQAYLTRTMSDTLELLPAQWLVESAEWAPLTEGGQPPPADWITACGSCHVTGLNTATWEFTEFGIGCESCHGPAEEHAADPENVKPFASTDDRVCGACHSRGTSPQGYHHPATYRPGQPLTDHFTFTAAEDAMWPDGSAKYNHQQYMDWQLGNSMAPSQEVNCVTCHAVHDIGQATGQLHAPLNDLCVECHGQQEALIHHTPFHQQALRENEFTCADCHMPLMATSAEPFDLRNHSFLQPDPEGTIAHGGVETMPNACNRCHTGIAESPQWAAQTIAHAKSLAPESSFFGPGPTPTSPPPPTPMPSVGQPARLEVTPPFWWLRSGAFILLGVLLVAGIGAAVYKLSTRGTSRG